MDNTILTSANLTNVNFSDATLSNITSGQITPANGASITFTTDNYVSIGYMGGSNINIGSYVDIIRGANKQGVTFNNKDFTNYDLSGVDFSGAVFTSPNFTNANLTNTNFNGSSMTSPNFTNVTLTETNFSNVNLTNQNFSGKTLNKVKFNNATMNGTNFNNAQLYDVDFTGTNLSTSTLTNIKSERLLPLNGVGITYPTNYFISAGFIVGPGYEIPSIIKKKPILLNSYTAYDRTLPYTGDYIYYAREALDMKNGYTIMGAMGYPGNHTTQLGTVYFFKLNTTTNSWDIDTSFNYTSGLNHGRSVALSDDATYAFVSNKANILVYKRSGNTWIGASLVQTISTSHISTSGYNFLKYDGDFLISNNTTYNGRLHVYKKKTGLDEWEYKTQLELTNDSLVTTLSFDIHGDYIIAGSIIYSSNKGLVNIFRRIADDNWTIIYTHANTVNNQYMGQGVAIRDNIALYNNRAADPNGITDAGEVYAYKIDGNKVTYLATITAGTPKYYDAFGTYLTFRDNFLFAQSLGGDDPANNSGYINIIERVSDTDWQERGIVTTKFTEQNIQFGGVISVYQNYLVASHHLLANSAQSEYGHGGAGFYEFKESIMLANSSHTNKTFNSSNFVNLNLYGVDFTGSTFNDTSFTNSSLDFVNLTDVSFNNVDFSGSILTNVNFNSVFSINITPNDGQGVTMDDNEFITKGQFVGNGIVTPNYTFLKKSNTFSGSETGSKNLVSNANNYFYGRYSVGITDNYAIVGSGVHDSNKGLFYIIKKDGNDWVTDISFSGLTTGKYLGRGVDISGSYAYVTDRDKLYFYKNESGTWSKLSHEITGFNASYEGYVRADGDNVLYSQGGVSKIYKNDGADSWDFQYTLDVSSADIQHGNENNIAIHNGYAAVGFRSYSSNKGLVNVYREVGGSWSRILAIINPTNLTNKYFGHSVAIHGNFMVISAYREKDGVYNNAGKVYVYKLDGNTRYIKSYFNITQRKSKWIFWFQC